MSRVTIAKLILGIGGIGLFLWASDDDQTLVRWIAAGLIVAAWMLRFLERGERHPHRHQPDREPDQGPSM